MNKDQIYETVINKSNRILKLVTIADFEQSKKIRNILMGSIIAPRKEFINNYLEKHIRKKTKDN
jgi:DNA gyrase subunit B